MITNFALSLSFDGIRLLQRVENGWHLVGETEIDVPDLPAALEKLHATALSLDPSGLRTKLLIPNEQIKYLTLETAQTTITEVMTALDGATPYPIDELVVDFDRTGGRTYIAAVARETLAEAEAFANEHHFNPVSFAAIAEPLTFNGEVFFGPTALVAKNGGGSITREDTAFVVTGQVKLPEPALPEDEEPVLFTPRARMATPESVAEPKVEEPEVLSVHDTAKVSEKTETTPTPKAAPVLAVPVGDVKGPAVATPSQSPAPTTTIPPVVAKMREPTVSPVIKRTPQQTQAVPVKDTPKPAAPDADDMASIGGFSSRRAAPAADVRPQEPKSSKPTRADKKAAAITSKQAKAPRNKPRFLGLILTVILLIAMAIVALWASTLSEEDLASWFGQTPNGIVEVAQPAPPEPDPNATDVVAVAPEAVVAAVPAAEPSDENTNATALPQIRATPNSQIMTPAEADRIYAATGVWQRAPRFPLELRTEPLDALVTKPSDAPTEVAAVLMPDMSNADTDFVLLAPIDPPAPGTQFERDAQGLVIATPEGARTPLGAIVFAGAPIKRPPTRPVGAIAAALPDVPATPEGVIVTAGRPSKVPPLRPNDASLPEQSTEAEIALGGVDLTGIRPNVRPDTLAPEVAAAAIASDPALAGFRPKVRPEGLAPEVVAEVEEDIIPEPTSPDITAVVAAIAEAAPASPFVNPTARAVRTSSRPDPRPRNFSRVVSRATDLANRQAANTAAAANAVATATANSSAPTTNVSNNAAAPSGSVPTSVARAATLESAIKLRDINLIGVYGQPNNRRALVRLGNGRYVKVEIGSSLDGGRVTAIGDNALNYVKRGKTYALQLPTG